MSQFYQRLRVGVRKWMIRPRIAPAQAICVRLHPNRCRRPNGHRRLPPRNPSPASLVPAVHKYPINTPDQTFMTTSFSAALDTGHPDRFSDTHLRTLQRRVQQWRGIMAKKLVYTTAGEPMPELPAMPELALVEGAPSAKVSVTFLNEETGTGIYA